MVFEGFRETVPFSGNRSFRATGAHAENTMNLNGFHMFPEGRPDAPGAHPNHRMLSGWAKLIGTHMNIINSVSCHFSSEFQLRMTATQEGLNEALSTLFKGLAAV